MKTISSVWASEMLGDLPFCHYLGLLLRHGGEIDGGGLSQTIHRLGRDGAVFWEWLDIPQGFEEVIGGYRGMDHAVRCGSEPRSRLGDTTVEADDGPGTSLYQKG
jgi:hypothetical protein